MKDQYVYPSAQPQFIDGTECVPKHHPGLTLRQHYAGLAMQGLLANPVYAQQLSENPHGGFDAAMGKAALYYADALIAAERSKP